MFEQLMEEIKSAKHFIFMEYFIIDRGYMWDSILEVLKQKAAEGVEVRVMYDGMCCPVSYTHLYVVSSFFLPSGYVFRNYPVSICDGVWQVKIGKWKELFFIR